MASLSINTVMMSIQAIAKQIEHFEGLLGSETVRDKGDIQELLLSLDNAAQELKVTYSEMRGVNSNFPPYESLIE